MSKYTVKVLDCDKPTSKGYIYPKSEMDFAIRQFLYHSDCLGGFLDDSLNIGDEYSLSSAAFSVDDLKLVDKEVFAEINILPTETGKSLQELLNINPSLIRFTVIGRGKTKNKTVFDYKLSAVVCEMVEK